MKRFLLCCSLLLSINSVDAAFITPDAVISSQTSGFGAPSDLIDDATGTSYIAPNPSSGGGGTSNWTSSDFNTWTFNLDSIYTLDTLYLWDYYGHSPKSWELNFFDGLSSSGNNLGTVSFNIIPGAALTSTFHEINFTEISNVLSVTLGNTSLSATDNPSPNGGVGLSEVHFGASVASVPAPSVILLLGSGLAGLIGVRKSSVKLSGKHA